MTGAGDLDRRITIQRATTTLNEFNEPIETWTDHATVWAKRSDASAVESYRTQEVGAEITARFIIRRSTQVHDVNPRDRVSFNGKVYNITRVSEPVGTRNFWLEIHAAARADEPAEVSS